MMSAIAAAIAAARTARIPVFTIMPGAADRGTLFDVGLDFHELGRLTGVLAARVLGGIDPATLPIRDVLDEVPRRLVINTTAARGLRERWSIPDDALQSATVLVDDTGVHERAPAAASRPALARKWRLDLVQFNNVLDVEEAEEGVLAGLREAGLVEGRDYVTTIRNAQGDMATVSSLIDAALVERTDLLITFSTPTLQAALARARNVPIVFNYLASPIAAGAGTSDTDHLPNVTGVYMAAAFKEMLTLIRAILPAARTLGTLYVPAEVNTVFYKDRLLEETAKAGFELITVAANTSSDVGDAALALVSRRPDAICQVPGNLTASAFPSIAQAAGRARLPVFAFQSSQVRTGASLVVGRDYPDSGRQAAALAARIMRGERPASLPFQPVTRTRMIVNLDAARHVGPGHPARHHRTGGRSHREVAGSSGSERVPDMEMTRHAADGCMELTITGRLDGYWADHLDAGLTETVRDGHHRLRLNLSGVTFISSAGIAVLVKFYKRLTAIKGGLVISSTSKSVRTVLDITRLSSMLIEETPSAAPETFLGRVLVRNGLVLQVFDLAPDARLVCHTYGEDGPLSAAGRQCCDARLPRDAVCRWGSAHSAGRMQTAQTGSASSWRSQGPRGTCRETARMCPTTWWRRTPKRPRCGRFAPSRVTARSRTSSGSTCSRPGRWSRLSELAAASVQIGGDAIGMVMVAEAAGLVGASLRQAAAVAGTGEFFAFPAVRARLTFTAERAFARTSRWWPGWCSAGADRWRRITCGHWTRRASSRVTSTRPLSRSIRSRRDAST